MHPEQDLLDATVDIPPARLVRLITAFQLSDLHPCAAMAACVLLRSDKIFST